MKKQLQKALCLLLLLYMGLSMLPLTVLAAGTLTANDLVNLYDSSTALKGGVPLKQSSGIVEKTGFDHNTSAYIAVTPGDVITFGPAQYTQDFHLHGYSDTNATAVDVNVAGPSSSQPNKKLVEKGVIETRSKGNFGILEYTVPTGVSYIRVVNRPAVDDRFLITKNQPFTVEMYCEKYGMTPPASQPDPTPTPTPTPTPSVTYPYSDPNAAQSVLYGKTAIFFGDSITEASRDNYKGWAGQIGAAYSMTWHNYGVSGAAVSNRRKYGQIVNHLAVHASKPTDYVIMHGGVNDAWDSVTVGTMTSGFDPSKFNNATFAGGLENLFYTARMLYPNATYGFIINFTLPQSQYGATSNMTAYVNMAKQICQKYKIPYLDLYNDTDFCNNVLQTSTKNYLADYIHPNAEGYVLLSRKIAPWMETLTRSELAEVPSENTSPLYKKSALFIGDSICQGTQDSGRVFTETGKKGWGGRIGERNSMTYVNAGTSGFAISTCRSGKHILTQLAVNKRKTFDYVIMHGGVNDAWDSVAIGTLSDSFNYEDFDQSTFIGGLEATFCRAKEWYPDATYGFIINFKMPNANAATLQNISAYVNAMKAVCEKWEIPYLDLYNDADFCNNVLKVSTTNYFSDGIHPKAPGYDLLANKIQAWMETLPVKNAVVEPPVEEGDNTPPVETLPVDTTPAPVDTTTAAPVEEKKKGCGATLSAPFAVVTLITVLGAGIAVRKREER